MGAVRGSVVIQIFSYDYSHHHYHHYYIIIYLFILCIYCLID